MRFEVHSFYIHNLENLTPIHPHPTLTPPAWPPLLLHLLSLPGRRVHRSARFRGHSPLPFFEQPSSQASQTFLAAQAALTVYTPWESAALLPDTGTLSILTFPTMCPYRAYRPDHATTTRPESAPFYAVSAALSPTVFRATFLPSISGNP